MNDRNDQLHRAATIPRGSALARAADVRGNLVTCRPSELRFSAGRGAGLRVAASTYPTDHLGWWPRGEMAMNGLARFVATLAIVLAVQLGQSTQTMADRSEERRVGKEGR